MSFMFPVVTSRCWCEGHTYLGWAPSVCMYNNDIYFTNEMWQSAVSSRSRYVLIRQALLWTTSYNKQCRSNNNNNNGCTYILEIYLFVFPFIIKIGLHADGGASHNKLSGCVSLHVVHLSPCNIDNTSTMISSLFLSDFITRVCMYVQVLLWFAQ